MSEWETYGYRVTWLLGPAFAHQEPSEHEEVVQDAAGLQRALNEITRTKPITERPTYRPRVFALQRRTEHREVPVGLAGYERN